MGFLGTRRRMSALGQSRKYSRRADVFRSTPKTGHRATQSSCPFRAKGRHSRAIHWRCSPVDLRHPGGGARSSAVRIVLRSAFKRPSSARGSTWKRPKYRSRSVVAGWRCEAAESFFNELREGERGLVPPLRGDRLIADRQARAGQPCRTDRRG